MRIYLRKILGVWISFFCLVLTSALMGQSTPHFLLSGTTTHLRLHGQSEVLGDLVLTCDVAGNLPPQASLTVFLNPVFGIVNAADTSNTFVSASAVSPGARLAYFESEPSSTGLVLGTAHLDTTTSKSITVGLSGSAAIGDIIRIMGIRANIGEENLPSGAETFATVLANPPNAFQIDNTNTFPVGMAFDEIKVQADSIDPPGSAQALIKIFENFPSALTSDIDENSIENTPFSPSAKLASKGTQIEVIFDDIPSGIKITLNPIVLGTDSVLRLSLVTPLENSFANSGPTIIPEVSFSYEVIDDLPTSLEEVDIPVLFSLVASPYPFRPTTIFAHVRIGPAAGKNFNSTIPSSDILSFANVPLLGDGPTVSSSGILLPPTTGQGSRPEGNTHHLESPIKRF